MAKKILVPGAGIGQVNVLKKARGMGISTVVVSPDGDYPGFRYADVIYHADVRDRERVLEIARRERIDGIVSDQNDIPVETIGYVAERMDLTGNSYATSKVYSRKDLMREKCLETGIPSVSFDTAGDLDGCMKLGGELGFPLMCKPTDNQSSKGVFRVADAEELARVFYAVRANAFSGKIIIEKFIPGKEYIVDGLAIGGQYKSLLVLDNENFDLPGICIPRGRTSPAGLNDDQLGELLALDRQVNASFGLANGLSHNEYMLNPSEDKFYLIDAAARGGGAFISSHLLPYASGFDVMEMLIRLALGEHLDLDDYPPASKAVCYMSFYLREGTIRHIEGMDVIRNMDCVLGIHEANLETGKKVKGLVDKSDRYGPILIGCERLTELDRAKRFVKNTLVISTDKSRNAVIWD
jgi:biotin carboxylase